MLASSDGGEPAGYAPRGLALNVPEHKPIRSRFFAPPIDRARGSISVFRSRSSGSRSIRRPARRSPSAKTSRARWPPPSGYPSAADAARSSGAWRSNCRAQEIVAVRLGRNGRRSLPCSHKNPGCILSFRLIHQAHSIDRPGGSCHRSLRFCPRRRFHGRGPRTTSKSRGLRENQ